MVLSTVAGPGPRPAQYLPPQPWPPPPQPWPPPPPQPPPPWPPPPPVLKPVHDEAAYFPLRSSHSTSKVTEAPSSRYAVRSCPSPWSLLCTNTSSPPSSGVMKPNPLSSKNFLTVPVGIVRREGSDDG